MKEFLRFAGLKKLIAVMFPFILAGFNNPAICQNLAWAKQIGGSGDDVGYSVAVDASGNVYTTGLFTGTVDFDPGAGNFSMTSAGGNDIFISKLDAAGNFVWAKQFGGSLDETVRTIVVDANGNVYTIGYFYRTVDFDPGPATYNLTSYGDDGIYADVFISKLDAAGNFVWAKQMGGTSFDFGYSIAVDASGNVYTTGNFAGVSDFDPGAGVYNLTSTGALAIFVSKLDAAGNFVWAKQMGVAGSSDYSVSIAVDAGGNVYTTGFFSGSTDFDPGAGSYILSSAGGIDIFISKLDASGNFVWAKQLGGAADDYVYSIALDAAGNVYTIGYFEAMVDFDPGAGTYNLVPAGPRDIFVSKLDAAGNFVYAKQFAGTDYNYGESIAVDAGGNVYTIGFFLGTTDFDPGPATYNLVSAGGFNSFVCKLDAAGNFVWAKQFTGTDNQYSQFIALDASGNVYTTGSFASTVDFDPGAGTYNLTATGQDVFIVRLSNIVLPIDLISFAARVNDKKTVDISWATASEKNNNYFTVERSKDGLGFEQVAVVSGAINSNLYKSYQTTDKTPYTGRSYYRLKQTDADGKYTYSAVATVQIDADNNSVFIIYPNPVHDLLQVQTTGPANQRMVWQVQDAMGKTLISQTGKLNGNRAIITIEIAALAKGAYYLVLKADRDISVKKFIKQ